MAHYRVLMIGTEANLMQIYADCQDSSSESKAEMAFAYDYLVPYKKITLWVKANKHIVTFLVNNASLQKET